MVKNIIALSSEEWPNPNKCPIVYTMTIQDQSRYEMSSYIHSSEKKCEPNFTKLHQTALHRRNLHYKTQFKYLQSRKAVSVNVNGVIVAHRLIARDIKMIHSVLIMQEYKVLKKWTKVSCTARVLA